MKIIYKYVNAKALLSSTYFHCNCFQIRILLSTFAFKYFKVYDILDKQTMETMENLRDQFLTVSEVFMYIVLIMVFSPHRKSVDIKLSREEQ